MKKIIKAAVGLIAAVDLLGFAGDALLIQPRTNQPQTEPARVEVVPMAATQTAQEWDQDPEVESPTMDWTNDFMASLTMLDAPLDTETQWRIYGECDFDKTLFCTVMAIANHETDFDTDAVGDGGNSIGMMQINTPWHTERIAAIGVTDLTDPAQNARVAISILRELETRYGYTPGTHGYLIAYNAGPGGARKILDAGYDSTEYSRTVMDIFNGYMAQMQ